MIRTMRTAHPVLAIALTLLVLAAMLSPLPANLQPTAAAAVARDAERMARAPMQPAAIAPVAMPRAQAMTNTLTLRLVNARTEPRAFDGAGVTAGELISSTLPYQFQIVEDNTGDPFDATDCFAFTDPPTNTMRNLNYPDGCDWPGVRTNPGWAPIVTQGSRADLNETQGLTLPDGNYLISVLVDGYKIEGKHFTVPLADPGLLEVGVQPLPLPPAEMVIQVFHDRSMTNGQFDAPVEQSVCPGPNCMEGFRLFLNDTIGEITNDMYGNPLCTVYQHDTNGNVEFDPDGNPIIQTLGGECLSDADGFIRVSNLGPLRYDVLVTPPDGTDWVQTTTLEGSQGWDTWLQEAGTGLDNEFIVAAEPFPWTIFGFVKPTDTLTAQPGTGSIQGVIMAISSYTPSQGGLPHQGDIWGGLMGVKLERPIAYPWLALNDLQNGDTAVWVGQGNADGSFEIPDVPPGDYSLTYWDQKQHFILDFVQVTVQPNEVADVGVRTMTGWFQEYAGHVFLDYNENGRMDPGEPGVPDYLVVLRDRDNTEIDRMSISALTDSTGFYEFEKAYPMTSWMVLEAYHDLYRTTGVTFQAGNQPEETTLLEPMVDIAVLPILSQNARLDWGVKPYDPGTNGGIAGTVFYDTMRAEDDAAYAGAEPYQPGIPDLTMNLYATVPCTATTPTCDASGTYALEGDGSYAKGALLNTTVTENFVRPKDCQPRDVNGDPVTFPSLPPSTGGYDCLEAPLMGSQFGLGQQELPGNWGFGEVLTDAVTGLALPAPELIQPGDYLVEVVIPDDPILGRPLYQVTREEDLNMFEGDTFVPQVAPPPCAGPLHIVDVAGVMTDGYELPWAPGQFSTPVDNPGYVEAGGSRFEGQAMPLCNVKLVTVADQKSVAPIFTMFTDVPIPGRWRGYIIDDLNVSTNPLELTFGEKAGLANMPVGVYDFTGRRVDTIYSDFHGVYEVLLASDATYNAPTPSGILANVYYIYGNDPGQPGDLNPGYNPQYRSIGTSFEVYPGVMVPSDLAPTQNGALIWNPTSNVAQLAQCKLDDTTPQVFAVSQPYGYAGDTFAIYGTGFGATPGQVTLVNTDGTFEINLATTWDATGRVITATVPTVNPSRSGPYQMVVTAANGQSSINGLTFHVMRNPGYHPALYEVGVDKTYDPSDPLYAGPDRGPIQHAIDDAYDAGGDALVVVYPGAKTPFTNPLGIYFENPVIYSPVKLQGIGPGGVYTDETGIDGAILDGRGMGGTEAYATWWRTNVGDIWLNRGGWDGSPVDGNGEPQIYEGPVVTVFAEDGEFTSGFRASIDGFKIQGGDQQGMPNNFDQFGQPIPGVAPNIVVQGGGIFVNGYARYLQITNNDIESNGGAYAGAIRLGTPDVPEPLTDHQNDNITIGHNRILANGGTNLAGGIGVFAGTEDYEIAYNDICGNFSAEYGGGISHYGYSPGGIIHDNRIIFNRSYDEGGGIMIAGQLPADPTQLSPGAGEVDVYANLIQGNLANDDGGGLRFLMAGDFPFNVYNNIVANNVSTHEGGGISLNDAPDVRIVNNTVMKNITTATAMTSNGLPAPAGLSSSLNSALLQATLQPGSPLFSDPLNFNNIFWDNRAGAWSGGGVSGIGLTGDPSPIFHWDLGVAGGVGELSPTYTLMQVPNGVADATNVVGLDPMVVQEYDLTVRVFPWRGNPNFVGADIVAIELPLGLLGDYHLQASGSPAQDAGTQTVSGVSAPNDDIDGDPRPNTPSLYDLGADEIVPAFPATAVLFPAPAAMAQAAEPLSAEVTAPTVGNAMTYTVFLPLVIGGTGQPLPAWGGLTDSFDLDPAAGVSVAGSGYTYWQTSRFAGDLEVYLTFTDVALNATRQDLLLKIGGLAADGTIGPDTVLVNVGYDASTGQIEVRTLSPGLVWQTLYTFAGVELQVGDVFGARVSVGGIVEVFVNGQLFGSVDLTAGGDAWPYRDDPGFVGVWFEAPAFTGDNSASFTDFGGGSLP
jgi:hypothetical protein